MQRLNRSMLERYDIPVHAPGAVRAVQFGVSEAMLGVVDRLLDEYCPDLGVACVPSGEPWAGEGSDPAQLLAAQEGLFTLLVRGYRGETPVKREVVAQSILRVAAPGEALEALAREPGLALGCMDTGAEDFEAHLRNAAQLLAERYRAGLDGLVLLCLGERADCARGVRSALLERASEEGFAKWLDAACAFLPAVAEGFAFRADAKAAAKQCAEMNYADGLLHLAEPFARLTVQVPADLRAALPLAESEGIRLVEDLAPALAEKARLFDAGLFAMAAPGWLLGCDTLADCMKHERLRAFVGRTYYDELLPADPAARDALTPQVVQVFERFENPLTDNELLRCSRPLLRRFREAVLPLMRAWADENFEPPRRLSFALAATIMLYAGARPGQSGRYEVARGKQTRVLEDDPGALAVFSTLSHDMPPEALAYAALADRELWDGEDLRQIDGLEARVALDIANLQRRPDFLPE